MPIEVEIRSFISDEQFVKLIDFFKEHGSLILEDEQETIYFDAPVDLRIQKNNILAKIILKGGIVHDESREETEIKIEREKFNDLLNLFTKLGFKIKIKWLRKRLQYSWRDITVCLDDTKGYGKIIELEKMATEEEKENALITLKEKLNSLQIEQSPRELFERKFKEYEKNWKNLLER